MIILYICIRLDAVVVPTFLKLVRFQIDLENAGREQKLVGLSNLRWGNELAGGTCGVEGLHDVSRLFATSAAFAALRKDGTARCLERRSCSVEVVTWGDPNAGGCSG